MNALSLEQEVRMGWRRHSREFKQEAVARMKDSKNIHELARELDVERKLLYTWKYQFEGQPEKNHASYGKGAPETVEKRLRGEIQDLQQALGRKSQEVDFFVSALRRVSGEQLLNATSGAPTSTPKSGRGLRLKAKTS